MFLNLQIVRILFCKLYYYLVNAKKALIFLCGKKCVNLHYLFIENLRSSLVKRKIRHWFEKRAWKCFIMQSVFQHCRTFSALSCSVQHPKFNMTHSDAHRHWESSLIIVMFWASQAFVLRYKIIWCLIVDRSNLQRDKMLPLSLKGIFLQILRGNEQNVWGKVTIKKNYVRRV